MITKGIMIGLALGLIFIAISEYIIWLVGGRDYD